MSANEEFKNLKGYQDIQSLRLGTAKIDITPLLRVPLAGFASRTGLYEGIRRRLFARIWAFRQADRSGCAVTTLLVQADLLCWGTDRVEGLKREISRRWGLESDGIVLHASHTHSGPQTSELISSSVGAMDRAYIERLEANLIEGAGIAIDDLEAVVVAKGTGSCAIGIHRRKIVDGTVEMAPNPDGPVDPEVQVFRFATASGRTKGVWFHCTCHPTTADDNFVSSEFPGVAMDSIEERIGDGAIASFMQGCCGDVRPALIRDGQFYKGGEREVNELGMKLADEVTRVLGLPMKELAPALSKGKVVRLALVFQSLPKMAVLQAQAEEEGLRGEWSRLMIAKLARGETTAPFEMCGLNIADGLSLLGMNGEMAVEYGLYIKRMSGGAALPLAYTNGMIGYVTTAAQLEEGGYEPIGSAVYFGLPSPFDSSAEPAIRETIAAQFGSDWNSIGQAE